MELPGPVSVSVLLLAVPSLVFAAFRALQTVGAGRHTGGTLGEMFIENTPRWLLAAGPIAFVAFMLIVATATLSVSGGSPERRDGQYVTNNHGSITVISREAYLSAKEREHQVLTAGAGAFCAMAAMISTALAGRSTRSLGSGD